MKDEGRRTKRPKGNPAHPEPIINPLILSLSKDELAPFDRLRVNGDFRGACAHMTEFELIAKFTAGAPREAGDLILGAGDDCAVIARDGKMDWLVTADALIEGTHFRPEWTDMKTLGRKALSVNLSDIAAMGGTPRFYLVSIGLPLSDAQKIGEEIFAGMREVATMHDALLIGGDTVASKSGIMISITAIGEVEHGRAVLRSNAKPGDGIYVTGTLGSSALGLVCLKRGINSDSSAPFIKRHLDPSPRVKEAGIIASRCRASAMIDISDGLVADLSHIADESGVGFTIDASKLPVDKGFAALANELLFDPVKMALSGGEDYELVFTTPKEIKDSAYVRIGTILADKKIRDVIGRNGLPMKIDKAGFDHFNTMS